EGRKRVGMRVLLRRKPAPPRMRTLHRRNPRAKSRVLATFSRTLSRKHSWQGLTARGIITALAVIGLLCAPSSASAKPRHHAPRGVIFVHGFEGSGSQFESQKLRLTSNGYPDSWVAVFEYNSLEFASAIESGSSVQAQEQQLFAEMDGLVAHMKAVTHRRKVDLLGHSLGTKLMQDYLNSSKQRAAN